MPYIIAEIGFNHGGDAQLATDMISAAKGAGADAVKLQSFYADDLYFPDHAMYQTFKSAELSEKDHANLKKKADDVGIDFISTPFSPHWVDVLAALNPAYYKIASMDVNNPVLLKAVAATGGNVILSSGACRIDEVKRAMNILREGGAKSVTVLHCVSNYPTAPDDAMLWMIPVLQKQLDTAIGFSDHTLGIAVPLSAVAMGAVVIEKHFTIDKTLPGPDHAISADPAELKALTQGAKAQSISKTQSVEVAEICATEPPGAALSRRALPRPDSAHKASMRRGIYAGREIAKGETIPLDALRLVRPEITPLEKLGSIVGRPANREYKIGEPLG